MMRLYVLIMAAAALSLPGCDHFKSHFHEHGAAAGLPELNNGKRWMADAPTREGFARLRADLTVFEKANPSPSPQAYNVQAQKISESINSIFAVCKMTGPGHDQLHRYIQLILNDLEPLKSGNAPAAREAWGRIKANVSSFETYFE